MICLNISPARLPSRLDSFRRSISPASKCAWLPPPWRNKCALASQRRPALSFAQLLTARQSGGLIWCAVATCYEDARQLLAVTSLSSLCVRSSMQTFRRCSCSRCRDGRHHCLPRQRCGNSDCSRVTLRACSAGSSWRERAQSIKRVD